MSKMTILTEHGNEFPKTIQFHQCGRPLVIPLQIPGFDNSRLCNIDPCIIVEWLEFSFSDYFAA